MSSKDTVSTTTTTLPTFTGQVSTENVEVIIHHSSPSAGSPSAESQTSQQVNPPSHQIPHHQGKLDHVVRCRNWKLVLCCGCCIIGLALGLGLGLGLRS